MKSYAAYQDSGIEWLGEIPQNWLVAPLRALARVQNGADYKKVESDDGYPEIGSGGAFAHASEFLYDGESVLLGRKGTIDRPRYVRGRFWTVDTMFYTHVSPRHSAKFLYYASTTIPFFYYATSTALPSMTKGDLEGHRLALPALEEQRAIAAYLDRETAQMDELIGEQEVLIESLIERRQSVMSELLGGRVGTGRRLKWSFTEIDHRAGVAWQDLPLLSVSIAWGVRDRSEVTDDLPRAEDLAYYKTCEPGDIVVNRMRAFQGALGVSKISGMVSPDYAVLRTSSEISPQWLELVMRSRPFVSEMRARIRGIGSMESGSVRTPRIGVGDVGEIRVAPTTLTKQQAEVDFVVEQTTRIDVLSVECRDLITLLKERRSALISAAVTGKIDVRDEVA